MLDIRTHCDNQLQLVDMLTLQFFTFLGRPSFSSSIPTTSEKVTSIPSCATALAGHLAHSSQDMP